MNLCHGKDFFHYVWFEERKIIIKKGNFFMSGIIMKKYIKKIKYK